MAWPSSVINQDQFNGNLRKNVAGQIIQFFMADDNGAITGEAVNIEFSYSIDGGAVVTTVGGQSTPYEVDSTNYPGWYEVRPSQAETNGDVLVLQARKDSGMGSSPYPRETVVLCYTRVDHENEVMGSGFTATTDSLAALRGAMVDSLVAVQRDD